MKSVLWILGTIALLKLLSDSQGKVIAVPATGTPDNVPPRPQPLPAPVVAGPPMSGTPPMILGSRFVSSAPIGLATGPQPPIMSGASIVDCRQAPSTFPFCYPTNVDPLIGY